MRELHGALRLEPSSVNDTFGSLRGFADTVKATFSLYPDKGALADLDREVRPVHSYNPLVQIEADGRRLTQPPKKRTYERPRTRARSSHAP